MDHSKKKFHIPTINIAPYLENPVSEAAAQIVKEVRDACMSVGFFSLVGHGIPRTVQDDLFEAAKKLFSLPLDEKLALKHPILKNRGYELIGSQSLQEETLPDLKEVSTEAVPRIHWSLYHSLRRITFFSGLLHWQTHAGQLGTRSQTPPTARRQCVSLQSLCSRVPTAK